MAIVVIAVKPGKPPLVDLFGDSFEDIRDFVGGPAEKRSWLPGFSVWIKTLQDGEPNRIVGHHGMIYGPFAVVSNPEFRGITAEDLIYVKRVFRLGN